MVHSIQSTQPATHSNIESVKILASNIGFRGDDDAMLRWALSPLTGISKSDIVENLNSPVWLNLPILYAISLLSLISDEKSNYRFKDDGKCM